MFIFIYALYISVSSGTFQGMFKQILSEDELVRERAIKFLGTKVKGLGDEVIDKEAEEYLVSQCKQVCW